MVDDKTLLGTWNGGYSTTTTNGSVPMNTDWPVQSGGYRQVKIDKVANGFIVEIGCKKFVAEKWDLLANKLAEYWDDPVAAEKKYAK